MNSKILGYLFLFSAIWHAVSAIVAKYASDLYFDHMILAGVLLVVSILFDNRSIYEKAARNRNDGQAEQFRNAANRRTNQLGNGGTGKKDENRKR